MSKQIRRIPGVLLVLILPTLLSACVLRSLFGNVIIVEDIGEEVNEIITTVFSDSTAAVCLDTDFGFYECTYIVDGQIITSTLYLLSEFGFTGVLIDPVILQLPIDVTQIHATYDDGNGTHPLVKTFTNNFYVTPDITITAESNQQFIILELPPSVTNNLPPGDPNNGLDISYDLTFTRTQPIDQPVEPVAIKVMLTGKVVLNEHPFYVPLMPCVTDFSLIPSITIPQSVTPVDLQPSIGDLITQSSNAVCDHQAYYFNSVPPPYLKTFLPVVTR